MFVDTHCHLNFKAFKKDLNEVISRAKAAGVKKIIVPGAKIKSSKRATKITSEYEGVYAAVGVHPHHANEEFDLAELKKLAEDKNTVAIGEIGLDRHQYKDYPPTSQEEQKRQVNIFLQQLKIAKDLYLPVIIHCREAQNLLLTVLSDFMNKNGKLKGVFHCFEGDEDYLMKVIDLGFYIGFDGNMTYQENKKSAQIIKKVPLDRLLLETDAPFLTPLPYRGSRNEPGHLVKTAEFIASLLKIRISKLAKITTSNAEGLFMLK